MGETTAIPHLLTLLEGNPRIEMINSDCERCGKWAPALHPFKLSEEITYYGKIIQYPWLCVKCLMIEKEKWWKTRGKG